MSLEDDLLEQRLRRIREIEALGFRAYGQRFEFTHTIPEILAGNSLKTAEELATRMADALLSEGVYVIGFSYPVVPKGKARIRTQMSAAHTPSQIDQAVAAFGRVGRMLGVVQ